MEEDFRAKFGPGPQFFESGGKLGNFQSVRNKEISFHRALTKRFKSGLPLAAGEGGGKRIPRTVQIYLLAKEMLKSGQLNQDVSRRYSNKDRFSARSY